MSWLDKALEDQDSRIAFIKKYGRKTKKGLLYQSEERKIERIEEQKRKVIAYEQRLSE